MKILQLGKHYPLYGGMEKFYWDLSQELYKNGYISDIFCSNMVNNNNLIKEENIKIYLYGRFAFKFSTSLSFKVFKYLESVIKEYDVIHVHLPDPMHIFALFVLRPKKPIIVHWHSDIVKQKYLKNLFLPFQYWILKRADKIITTSENYMLSSKDIRSFRHKCVAIPSGLNPERLLVDDKIYNTLLSKYKNKKIIYSFGRMTEYKGFEYLIEAVQYLPDDYIVIIAGGGDFSKYKELVKKYKLIDKVIFVGRIDDREVGAYYKIADIFVLPSISRNEAFGLVQCEAMYFGKPIISTDIPGSGVSFVNKNNETGFIVPIKDAKAISEKIIVLLNNKEIYNKFSTNSKKRFHKYFDISSITKEIIKIYKGVVK